MADPKSEITPEEAEAATACSETFQANVVNREIKWDINPTYDGHHIVIQSDVAAPSDNVLFSHTLFERVAKSISTSNPDNPGIQDIIIEYYPDANRFNYTTVLSRSTTPAEFIRPFVPLGEGDDMPFTKEEEASFMRQNGKLAHTPRQLELVKSICERWQGQCRDLLCIEDVDMCSAPTTSLTRLNKSSSRKSTAVIQCAIRAWCPVTISTETIKRIKSWSRHNVRNVDFTVEIYENPRDPSSREALVTVRITIDTPDASPPDWKKDPNGHRPNVKSLRFSFDSGKERSHLAQKAGRAAKLAQKRSME